MKTKVGKKRIAMKLLLTAILLLVNNFCFATYHSHVGQDRFVNENFFKNVRNGIFVDIGAYDGVTINNTYFFEKELGWTGICVEPIPSAFKSLRKNRKCHLVEGCVTNWSGDGTFFMITGVCQMLSGLVNKYDPRHVERIHREIALYGGKAEFINVKCYLLNDLLQQYGITHVNFLSLDTEGGEFDILTSIDFDRFQIDVITVEDNFQDQRFIPFLEGKGFQYVTTLEMDMIFVNKNFVPQ